MTILDPLKESQHEINRRERHGKRALATARPAEEKRGGRARLDGLE